MSKVKEMRRKHIERLRAMYERLGGDEEVADLELKLLKSAKVAGDQVIALMASKLKSVK